MSRGEIKLDPTTLRGIAHPLRVRILGILRGHGPATATHLAERLGQSTGATSYHLRQLAQYGFVVEDVDRGVGRERWWRAAHRTTVLDGDIGRQAPVEAEAYLRAVAAAYAERVDRWVGEAALMPEEWQESATASDWRLRLTPAEAKELYDALFALAARYRRDDETGPDTPEGAEQVVLQVQLMPFLGAGEEAGR